MKFLKFLNTISLLSDKPKHVSGFAYLASVGIRVEAVITDHHLSLVRDVGSHSRYEP